VLPASRFGAHRRQIVDLVAHRKLPAIYDARSFVQAGGLMSYSENITERLQRVATYVDKILKGAKPADLPIEQPTTFELVIHLTAAAPSASLALPHSSPDTHQHHQKCARATFWAESPLAQEIRSNRPLLGKAPSGRGAG
jgi:ABC transporter substrate binding protein